MAACLCILHYFLCSIEGVRKIAEKIKRSQINKGTAQKQLAETLSIQPVVAAVVRVQYYCAPRP